MSACHPRRAGWLLTDARLAGHGLVAARRLPPGSSIILRSDDLRERERRLLATKLKRIAVARGLYLFVAGLRPAQARRLGVHGVHLRSRSASQAKSAQRLGLATSAPVHNHSEARVAAKAGIDYALISPLFATRSHPGAALLPLRRFIALALATKALPIALGGMTAMRCRKLRLQSAASRISPQWAAIDAWEMRR
jgi:thiamine-phosphate pyrophosphorylase